jgi:hypothetical protein
MPLSRSPSKMPGMSTSTILIINAVVAIGLLTALALVMAIGHRAAGSKSARGARWSRPLELDLVRDKPDERRLDRAA